MNLVISQYIITLIIFVIPGFIFFRWSRYIHSYYKRNLPEIFIFSIIFSTILHFLTMSLLVLCNENFKLIYYHLFKNEITIENFWLVLCVMLTHLFIAPTILVAFYWGFDKIITRNSSNNDNPLKLKPDGDFKHYLEFIKNTPNDCYLYVKIILKTQSGEKLMQIRGFLVKVNEKEKLIYIKTPRISDENIIGIENAINHSKFDSSSELIRNEILVISSSEIIGTTFFHVDMATRRNNNERTKS